MRLKSIGLLSLFCTISFSLFSQSYRSKETIQYIEQFHKVAIREMYQYKIPASITLAQGILESASGRSNLAVKANNHFGIKCNNDYSGKKFYKDDDKRNDCFRVYSHPEESFRDHSVFLTKSRYSDLFKLSMKDYKGWAKGLKKAGYATNPKYPQLIIEVIEQNQLYVYDKNPEDYLSKSEAENYSLYTDVPSKKTVNNSVNTVEVKKGRINGVKCVQVGKGETFYGLAKKLNMDVEDIMFYNEFPSGYVLKSGEYVYLSRKKKKNKSYDVHVVQEGETLLSISQKYGIRKQSLAKMNKLSSGKVSVAMRLRLN